MIDKDKILQVLKLVADTIGTDYDNQKECKQAITDMVNAVNVLRSEIEEKPVHTYYPTLLEHLSFPQGKKYNRSL